jgi:hypothetical protein
MPWPLPENKAWYTFNRMLNGTQSWPGCYGKEKNVLLQLGVEPWSLSCSVSRLVIVQTELTWFHTIGTMLFEQDTSEYKSEALLQWPSCEVIWRMLLICVGSIAVWVQYSKSWDIRHLWDQRVAGYCNFLGIRTLYLMRILVYLATSWTDLTI